MSDSRGTPVATPLGVVEIDAFAAALRGLDAGASEAERIDRIAAMERAKGALAAAQARETAAFAVARRAAEAARGVPARRRGGGLGSEIGLARRESPTRGQAHLALAEALVADLPQTLAALGRGETTEWRATLVHRATTDLTPEQRRSVDSEVGPQLPRLGDKMTAAEACRAAYRIDPEGAVDRAAKAERDRRVSIRPTPTTMAFLTALLPVTWAVRVYGVLSRYADANVGGDCTRAQLMADRLVELITGQCPIPMVPTEPVEDAEFAGLDADGPPDESGGRVGTASAADSPDTDPAAEPAGGVAADSRHTDPAAEPAGDPTADGVTANTAAARVAGPAGGPGAGTAVDRAGGAALRSSAAADQPGMRLGAADRATRGTGVDPAASRARAYPGSTTRSEHELAALGGPVAAPGVPADTRTETEAVTHSDPATARSEQVAGCHTDRTAGTGSTCHPDDGSDAADVGGIVVDDTCGTDAGERTTPGADDAAAGPMPPARGPVIDLQLILTDATLFAGKPEPADLTGAGPLPAALARAVVADETATVFVRRLYADPASGRLVGLDSTRRLFPAGLRALLVARDRWCRTPYCAAPIRHIDHVHPAAAGGATALQNGQGLCQRCNLAKEHDGWAARATPDDTVTTTTPTGHSYDSTPPHPPRSSPASEPEQGLPEGRDRRSDPLSDDGLGDQPRRARAAPRNPAGRVSTGKPSGSVDERRSEPGASPAGRAKSPDGRSAGLHQPRERPSSQPPESLSSQQSEGPPNQRPELSSRSGSEGSSGPRPERAAGERRGEPAVHRVEPPASRQRPPRGTPGDEASAA